MAQTILDISTPNDGEGDPLRNAFDLVNQMFTELYTNKVDKIPGKGLSTNDFTDDDKTKLDGIAAGAEVNVQADILQDDDTQDDFIKNKEGLNLFRTDPQIEFFDGVTTTFTLPADKQVNFVFLNRTVLRDIDEWVQTGDTLEITADMIAGNRIQINFF